MCLIHTGQMFYFVSVSLGKRKTILNVSRNFFNVLVIFLMILLLFFIIITPQSLWSCWIVFGSYFQRNSIFPDHYQLFFTHILKKQQRIHPKST